MNPSLLILTTEAVAEVLHDEHSICIINEHRAKAAPESISRLQGALLWRGKVGKPEHAEECQRWRFIADKFTDHLNQWLKASGVAYPDVCASMSAAPKDITVDNIAEACLTVARVQDALIKVGIEGGDHSKIHASLEDARELLRGAFKREVNTKEAAEVVRLRSELNDAQAAVGRFAQRNAQAEAELIASQERERALSERLASIAGLSAGN